MSNKLNIGHGTSWTLIWYGFKTGFRFISNMILSRMLSPEMFGVAAIGNAFLHGMSMFSDLGLKQNVIRSSREDESFYQTVWTIQALRGLLLFIAMLFLAVPIGYLYDSEHVSTFLLIVAFLQLAMGLNNVEVLREFKTANIRKIAIMDIAASAIGLSIMVVWAFFEPSYVALAVGAVSTTTAFTALTFVVYPRLKCRIKLEREAVNEIITFGKWVFISTMLAFFVMQLDRLALGKLVSLELIGFYSIAWIWASIPSTLLSQWSGQVFYPLVSEVLQRNGDISVIRRTRRAYISVAVLGSIVLFAASEIMIAILYPASYSAVATLMRPLVGIAMITAIEQTYSDILIAHGLPKEKVIGQSISITIFLALLWPAFSYGGIEWFIYLLGGTGVIRVLWFAYRLNSIFPQDLLFDALLFIAYILFANVLFELNNLRIDHTYQLVMSITQLMIAGIATYWLFQKIQFWHAASPIDK